MKKIIKISVIIPVFNSQKYLMKCISSILNQSLNDFELILVDDKSYDNSLNICRAFQENDHRISIIELKENKGVDNARFVGLKNSRGKFLMFVDSDDWIGKNSLELLYNKMESEQSDVVYGSMVRVIDKWGLIKSKAKNNYTSRQFQNSIEMPELFEDYFLSYFGMNILLVSNCGKLYRRDVIIEANLQPTYLKMGEDLIFNMALHPYLKKVSFIDQVVYYYRFGGMTSKFNADIIIAALKMYELKKSMIHKYKYQKAKKFIIYELKNYLRTYIEMLLIFKPFSKEQSLIEISKLIENVNYMEVRAFYKKNEVNQDDFVTGLVAHDVEKMFEIIKTKVQKERFTRKIKQIASSILN